MAVEQWLTSVLAGEIVAEAIAAVLVVGASISLDGAAVIERALWRNSHKQRSTGTAGREYNELNKMSII